MTRKELPALGANIMRVVGSSTTCTPATVDSLKSYLMSIDTPAPPENVVAPSSRRSKPGSQSARAVSGMANKHKKKPEVAIRQSPQDENSVLQLQEKFTLATEVINATLKALTEAIKTPSAKKPDQRKPLVKSISGSNILKTSERSSPTPLQPVCVNVVSSLVEETCRSRRSSSAISTVHSMGLRSQAECARIAFSALRSILSRRVVGIKMPYLQLENGMSALVGKLMALGFDDLAIKELRVLKRRIDHSIDSLSINGDLKPHSLQKTLESKPSSTKDLALASLLYFENTNADGPLLALMIASQLQVLKLIASKPTDSEAEAAFKHILLNVPHSPVNLIKRQLDASPESRVRVTRQLELLAQSTLRLSSIRSASPDGKNAEANNDLFAHTAFKIQILVLEIRSIWREIACHRNDILTELVEPFALYISNFRRLSAMNPEDTYEIAKTAFTSLSTHAEFGTTIKYSTSGSRENPLLTVYQLLAELAQECYSYEEAIGWLERSTELLRSIPTSATRLCALLCRIASLQLRAFNKGTINRQLLSSLEEAVGSLRGDLRGESLELDDLLSVVATLRRLAFSVLQDHYKSSDKSKSEGSSEVVVQCSKLIILGVNFFIRLLGRSAGPKKTPKTGVRHEQRKSLVWNNAGPFFESVAAMARFSIATGLKDWERIDAGLQECFRLASALKDIEFIEVFDPTAQGLKELNLLSLSNAYWYHYQYLKQKGASSKEIQRSLQLSIEILKNRSCSEKLAGELPSKLEKYGLMCEASKKYVMAAKIFTEALQLQVDGGLSRLAAEAAASRPLIEIFGCKGSQHILGRLLIAYQRVVLEIDNQDSEIKLVFDCQNLPLSERGILLEQQLSAFASTLHVKSKVNTFSKALQDLVKTLLTVYTDSEFPIRRLRVSLQLLRIHFTHPTAVQPDMIEQILCSETSVLDSDCLSHDTGLSSFCSHLHNSRVLYSNMHIKNIDMEAVKRSLASWSRMLSDCSGLVSLQDWVDDTDHWILQLESFAEYLEAQGLELQRVTILHLLTVIQEIVTHTEPSAIASTYSTLGLQYARLGYSNQAGHALHKASKYLLGSENSGQVKLKWNLASAEYALGMSNIIQAELHLANAHDIFKMKTEVGKGWTSTSKERSQFAPMLADANYAHSLTAAAKGKFSEALLFARQNVKLNYRAWVALGPWNDKARTLGDTDTSESDGDTMVNQMSSLSLANSQALPKVSITHATQQAAALWGLVPRLFYGLAHLSQLFAHEGLLPQARYYIEQCQRVVDAVHSVSLRGRSLALLGSYFTRNGEIEKGLDLLRQAEKATLGPQNDQHVVLLNMFLADNYALQRDADSEANASHSAERILGHLMKKSFVEGLTFQSNPNPEQSLEVKMDQLTLSEAQPVNRPQTKRRAPAKKPIRKPAAKSKLSIPERDTTHITDALLLYQMKGKVLRQRAFTAMRDNKLDLAASLLSEAADIPNMPEDRLVLAMVKGHLYLRQAQENMAVNPVFCVLPESTISYPSLTNFQNHQQTTISDCCPKRTHRNSPPKKSPLKGSLRKLKESQTNQPSEFLELLNQAQESLISICNMAKTTCSTAATHKMTDLLTKNLMMLSTVTLSQPKSTVNPTFVVYAMELGRTVSSLRESLVIQVERQLLNRQEMLHWPRQSIIEDSESSTINNLLTFATFQTQYIDIIPLPWTVLSLSLSESQDEIRIAKIRSDQTPFILTLPLNRHNSRDPDEEFFGFKNGKDELREIIGLANHSAHDAQDMARKGANSEWWEVREALDTRLKELLVNVENIWFGGFRGIFSNTRQRPQLLSRFQQSLQNILDKHLPSRQKPGKKKKSTVPVFDPRVLELFVGLGAPTEVDDMDESLMDLLYFVIDILQFHGERNAYDEIDFDSIVIEVIDALRQYHEAAKNEVHDTGNNHIILILDKALHSFPWESLPCMNHHAVSRLPSLACLRDRIMRQNKLQPQNRNLPTGHSHHVDRSHGACILNPAGDLKATQAKFEQPLQELPGWTTITEREPTEDEMKSGLESHDIFLYLGHGSGSQYIRSRIIRNLEQCAVALLMGCSSGALTEAGEFEPFGTPINYIRAGCPAVLANLWDVTDKDIDRFSYTVLEKWGLFAKSEAPLPRSPVKRGGRGRAKAQTGQVESFEIDRVSLDEAVAQGRDSCKLRYLNGAAPVIYGIPVFLS